MDTLALFYSVTAIFLFVMAYPDDEARPLVPIIRLIGFCTLWPIAVVMLCMLILIKTIKNRGAYGQGKDE